MRVAGYKTCNIDQGLQFSILSTEIDLVVVFSRLLYLLCVRHNFSRYPVSIVPYVQPTVFTFPITSAVANNIIFIAEVFNCAKHSVEHGKQRCVNSGN